MNCILCLIYFYKVLVHTKHYSICEMCSMLCFNCFLIRSSIFQKKVHTLKDSKIQKNGVILARFYLFFFNLKFSEWVFLYSSQKWFDYNSLFQNLFCHTHMSHFVTLCHKIVTSTISRDILCQWFVVVFVSICIFLVQQLRYWQTKQMSVLRFHGKITSFTHASHVVTCHFT